MTMIGLTIPDDIVEKLAKIAVPGKKEEPESFHITMFYIEKELSIKEVLKVTELMYKLVKNVKPLNIKVSEVSSFQKGDDGVPIIVSIESEELLEFRKLMAKKLDGIGIKYSKKWPEYKPHLTLSYAKVKPDTKKIKLNWKCEHLVLWHGDYNKEQVLISVPFGFVKESSLEMLSMYCGLFNNLVK